jgi:hypothetical protein
MSGLKTDAPPSLAGYYKNVPPKLEILPFVLERGR